MVGLAIAAALIVIPRQTVFEPEGRDACEGIGLEFTGLNSDSGRYADPVPDGVRCVGATDPAVTEVEVDFFTDSEPLDSILAWIYRLGCVLTPIGVGLAVGFRLSRAR